MLCSTKTVFLVLASCVAACVPVTAEYLTIPVVPRGEEGVELAVIEVSLAELALRMDDLEPQTLAFYNLGRQPIPHELRDTDGDGAPDIAVVAIPVPAEGALLFAVCPGPRAGGSLPPGGVEGAITVEYENAYR